MGSIDDQLAALDPVDRESIARLYAIAQEVAPEAEQGTGYGMPALVYRGKPLLSVMRAKKHIGIYPFSPEAVAAVAGALDGRPGVSLDKGTVRCRPGDPLPAEVVRALVATRKDQIDG